MTSLTEEDTKTSSVCDVISNFPGLPSFKLSTVSPTYETSPSSTASKGRAKSKTRQSVASLFITVPPEQPHGSRACYSSRLSFDSALFKRTNEIYHAATIGARCFDENASTSLGSSDVRRGS